ncbi:hypothetical protein [Botrimarina colliarenosi]|uniref:hypothetical protein n=1 Tax=Botrimarina colliarenosi TaxID=2528001 RepID=UPI0011B7EA67|nr:hypothetical protein [Botrimarina colliarenosi]
MAVAALPISPTGPLSESQHREVAVAHDRSRKIRRAAGVAAFNGWSIGVLAALSAPFALFSLPALVLAGGMGLVAWNEFRGRRRLLAFDESAPAFLGWNQLGFLALIIVYCVWQLVTSLSGDSPFAAELAAKPQLREVFGSGDGIDSLYRVIVMAFYGVVIALSVVFQGGNAVYYFTRRKHVIAYRQSTPTWVREVQSATAGA